MTALLRFHLRSGVRVGMRAAVTIAAAFVVGAIIQDDPVQMVTGLARAAFAPHLSPTAAVPLVSVAVMLPAWAAGRLSPGLGGWMRHLPVSAFLARRSLTLGLIAAQLPLAIALAVAALVARAHGVALIISSLRWSVALVAGAMMALPVTRRSLVVTLGIAAMVTALFAGDWWIAAAGMLLVADRWAGDVHVPPAPSSWRSAGPLHARIAWRALGARTFLAGGLGLMTLGAGWLFVHNNGLTAVSARAPLRFFSGIAAVLCLYSLASNLAIRRPAWPLIRSLPWSAADRIVEEGLFLGGHALLLLLVAALQSVSAAVTAAALVPFLALRAVGYARRVADERYATLAFLGEGVLVVAIATLLPWTTIGWMAAALPAFRISASLDQRQKITRWFEWQHAHAGDATVRRSR